MVKGAVTPSPIDYRPGQNEKKKGMPPPTFALDAAHRTPGRRFLSALGASGAILVLLYFPEMDDGSGSLLGAAGALLGVWLGLAVVDGVRLLPVRNAAARARLATRAAAAGIGLGLLNLAANYVMALADPVIGEQMVERWSAFSRWSVVIAEPVLEEVIYRLLLMGAIAWVAARFTRDRQAIFIVALGVSSALFGIAHVFYGGVAAPMYQLGIAAKSGVLALALGWIFWRWGLPYAILAHSTANAVHLVLWPLVF